MSRGQSFIEENALSRDGFPGFALDPALAVAANRGMLQLGRMEPFPLAGFRTGSLVVPGQISHPVACHLFLQSLRVSRYNETRDLVHAEGEERTYVPRHALSPCPEARERTSAHAPEPHPCDELSVLSTRSPVAQRHLFRVA